MQKARLLSANCRSRGTSMTAPVFLRIPANSQHGTFYRSRRRQYGIEPRVVRYPKRGFISEILRDAELHFVNQAIAVWYAVSMHQRLRVKHDDDSGHLPFSLRQTLKELYSVHVPMLMFNPPHMDVISSASSISSAIMGDAPQASRILAQSLTVT
jgi:hypothetical protein